MCFNNVSCAWRRHLLMSWCKTSCRPRAKMNYGVTNGLWRRLRCGSSSDREGSLMKLEGKFEMWDLTWKYWWERVQFRMEVVMDIWFLWRHYWVVRLEVSFFFTVGEWCLRSWWYVKLRIGGDDIVRWSCCAILARFVAGLFVFTQFLWIITVRKRDCEDSRLMMNALWVVMVSKGKVFGMLSFVCCFKSCRVMDRFNGIGRIYEVCCEKLWSLRVVLEVKKQGAVRLW